jgi:hypothetical protein
MAASQPPRRPNGAGSPLNSAPQVSPVFAPRKKRAGQRFMLPKENNFGSVLGCTPTGHPSRVACFFEFFFAFHFSERSGSVNLERFKQNFGLIKKHSTFNA